MSFLDRLKDDIVFAKSAYRALKMTTPIAKNPTRVFPVVLSELADRFGDAPALISDRESFSYRTLNERTNRYARWARQENLAKGETVCLLMPNRPEYLAAWLGITSAGGVAALININLVGPSLAYCIDIVEPKHIIVASELAEVFATARALLKSKAKLWSHGASAELPRIDTAVDALPGYSLAASERPVLTIEDRALYIYTSGTTGLPKAANINHYRVMLATGAFAGAMDGWKSGNLEKYETAAKQWEQNTKATLENNRQVMEKYKIAQSDVRFANHCPCTSIMALGTEHDHPHSAQLGSTLPNVRAAQAQPRG